MQVFVARLFGRNEVPPVVTAGQGFARIFVPDNERMLLARLEVSNLRNITAAHIHLGRPGMNGPIVAFLLMAPRPFSVGPNTRIADRAVTAADLIGPLAGQPISALVAQMRAGNAYVNVHTTQHPDGEGRGQLVRVV